MWACVFLLAILLVYLSDYLVHNAKVRAIKASLPGPWTVPILGNALDVIFAGRADLFHVVNGYWHKYGTRFRVFLGWNLYVLLSGSKDIEALLTDINFIEKSDDYLLMRPWLGTGLLTSTGEKWRKRRKAITPAFHFKILENFITVFDSQSDVLVKVLKNHADDNRVFDIFPRLTLCALDIISEATMGVSINAQTDTESEYVKAVETMCRIVFVRITNPLKRLEFFFKYSNDYRLQKKALKVLHSFTDKMIQERKKFLESSNKTLSSYTEDSGLGTKKKMTFLDLLLLSNIDGKPLSNLDIREEVDTFLFEGHDTTSSGISFCLFEIARNPNVQEKIYKELKEIFTDDFYRPAEYNDLIKMNYLELVIKESLRLYPAVPQIGRKITKDSIINGMELPKNTSILILIYNMHRNSAVFENPEKFIPERFLPEGISQRSPFASLIFSAGPRNCIGQKFAMLEMKSTISKVLRYYKLEDARVECSLTVDMILRSANGVSVKMSHRESF